MAAYTEPAWAAELIQWLRERGYAVRQVGPINPATGRGWYSHPCEYQRAHIRVRINQGGIVILRDPGCTLQVMRPAGHGMEAVISPNSLRLDYPHVDIGTMCRFIERFEVCPAYTQAEARERFC